MNKTTGIFSAISRLKTKGFFQIFSATIINSMISFVYGIFIVRLLTKSEYGLFSYTQSISNFGLLFCSLGLNLGILQYCTENRKLEQKYSLSKFAFLGGLLTSVITCIILLGYSGIDGSNLEGVVGGIIAFSFLPIAYWLKDWIISNLRWQLKNREYAIVMNVHSILNAVLVVLGAYLNGIYAAILGIYLAYLISIIVGLYYLREDGKKIIHASRVEKEIVPDFVKYSVTMCIVNAMISVLFTIDTFVIGNVLQNAEEIASYRTASVIPFALNMIPNAVMTFMYPYISRNKHDKEWLKRELKKVYIANGVLNIGIGICLLIIAEPLIRILFGSSYEGTVQIFRLLTISYMVSASLRTPSANILGMLKMTKSAFVVSTATVLLSAFLSYNLVKAYGITGAAYGSCITFTVVGIGSFIIIIKYLYKKQLKKPEAEV
ncbi:MAG: oligosaccharide flippase family protein [Lachnospiraceae bacterium]|jgi:O-antigen/teichoic acid export membrane protein|nr:oligosaccharide flippase family protein [Lachnospiraceae bacterium]